MSVTDEAIVAASQTVFDSVYVPVFVKRAAEHGIAFSSPEELQLALQNVVMLRQAEAQQTALPNLHKQANARLRKVMNLPVEPAVDNTKLAADAVGEVLNALPDTDIDELDKASSILAGLQGA